MRLVIQVFEDQRIQLVDLQNDIAIARKELSLDSKGIELILQEPTQITSLSILRACCDKIERISKNPDDCFIVFVDLNVTQTGCDEMAALAAHNSELPAALRLDETSSDRAKSGGYLLAWLVLSAGGLRNLLVIASTQESEHAIDRKIDMMRKAMSQGSDLVPHHIAKDSLAFSARRTAYIRDAVQVWLERYWCPLARIHPSGSQWWFRDDAPGTVMKHTWSVGLGNNRLYAAQVAQYLCCMLQLPKAEVMERYGNLNDSKREELHELMKALVGEASACHNVAHCGRRLQWRHLPLLGIASAPGPGRWPFDDPHFPWRLDGPVLADSPSLDDHRLLELLVGDMDGRTQGVLGQILTRKGNAQMSTLKAYEVQTDCCTFVVDYSTSNLAKHFAACVKAGAKQNRSSDALFHLHLFLQEHQAEVYIGTGQTIAIKRKSPQSP